MTSSEVTSRARVSQLRIGVTWAGGAPALALNSGTPRNMATGPARFRPHVISHFDAAEHRLSDAKASQRMTREGFELYTNPLGLPSARI